MPKHESKLKIDLIFPLHVFITMSMSAPWDHSPATYDFRSDTFPQTGTTCSTTWMILPRWVVKREWDCVGRTSGTWVCGRVTSCCFICDWQACCGPLILYSFLVWKVTDLDLFYTHMHTHTAREGKSSRTSNCLIPKLLLCCRSYYPEYGIYLHKAIL